ncbi:MAG: hypothetical protein GXP32_07355 [Kiritimatiellaeota bacterium]|nr:hypothetical protein [Kiritimatiellota bacterium]
MNVWSSLQPTSRLTLLKQVLLEKDESRVFLGIGLDRFLDEAAPEGNIILKFNGFPKPKKEHDRATPLLTYFRAVYHLYPRRVFVVPPGVIVNTGVYMADNPFHPSVEWMRKNNVLRIITLTRDPNGGIHTMVEKLPPLPALDREKERKRR